MAEEEEQPRDHIDAVVRKRRILWIMVGAITIFLAILWGIAFKFKLAAFNFNSGQEKVMMDNLKADWKASADIIKQPQAQTSTAETEVKNKLNELAKQLTASSSKKTATSTTSTY